MSDIVKIVKFKGGLGNQLFQYAFLRNLELTHGCSDVKGDLNYYSEVKNDMIRIPRINDLNTMINNISIDEISKITFFKHEGNPLSLKYKVLIYLEGILNSKYFYEKNRAYRPITSIIAHDYFDGYWQSWKNVENVEDFLRDEITLKKPYSKNTQETIDKIRKENAVFLGIRRGDYLATKRAKNHYGNFDNDYYNSAIKIIKKEVKDPVFYIFSNDIDWVKKNMKFDANVIYRDDKEQTNDVEELFIMGACKHAVIVNSTFYWWGAWLIKNKNKVIVAPKKWFKDNKPIDIVPDSWIKI